MSTIDEKRAAFHQYLASSGVISALSKALIKLYEEPTKPDDPVNFVRRHMGSEDFFILGDGKVQNAEEELVLSSLIEKKAEDETVVCNEEAANVSPENQQVVNDETENTETGNVDGTEEDGEATTVHEVDQSHAEFEKMKTNGDCTSMLKAHLTDEIFEKLKSVNSDTGVTLLDCIKSGLENHDSVLGIYATDLQCYDAFKEIFDPVIETCHGFGSDAIQSETNWGDPQSFEPFNGNDEAVMSIRIDCLRNMEEYTGVCRMAESDLNESLAKIKAITEGFDEASNGTFYNLTDLTDDQENELKAAGCLMTNSDKYISSANAYQQWPTGRGVFVAEDKSMAIQVNGEDHFKFVSMESGKDFGKAYQRLVDTISLFEVPFVRHDRLGWLTFSPLNLGTALHISVDLNLPKLHSNPEKLQEIIEASPIRLNLSKCETENAYSVTNQTTLGHTEFDLAKQFYDVVQSIIECEGSIE